MGFACILSVFRIFLSKFFCTYNTSSGLANNDGDSLVSYGDKNLN